MLFLNSFIRGFPGCTPLLQGCGFPSTCAVRGLVQALPIRIIFWSIVDISLDNFAELVVDTPYPEKYCMRLLCAITSDAGAWFPTTINASNFPLLMKISG